MAVSIGGDRVLHWFESTAHEKIENKDAQHEGDVYLSSPCGNLIFNISSIGNLK